MSVVSRKTRLNWELSGWYQKYEKAVEDNDVNKQLRARNKIKALREKLVKVEGRKVSDHAIVRYMERVMGIDIQDLENTILESEDIQRIVKGGIVVTLHRVR